MFSIQYNISPIVKDYYSQSRWELVLVVNPKICVHQFWVCVEIILRDKMHRSNIQINFMINRKITMKLEAKEKKVVKPEPQDTK